MVEKDAALLSSATVPFLSHPAKEEVLLNREQRHLIEEPVLTAYPCSFANHRWVFPPVRLQHTQLQPPLCFPAEGQVLWAGLGHA